MPLLSTVFPLTAEQPWQLRGIVVSAGEVDGAAGGGGGRGGLSGIRGRGGSLQ